MAMGWVGCGSGRKVLEVLLSGLILLEVAIVTHLLQVEVQWAEALSHHTWPGIQDATQVGLCQLLPVLKGHRTYGSEKERAQKGWL